MTSERIVCTRGVVGGKPRVDGTRIPVALILSQFASGDTIDKIVQAYPTLTRENVVGALNYAIDLVDPDWNRFDERMDALGGWTVIES
jgi:uncharacterized protein (DUF433 family)